MPSDVIDLRDFYLTGLGQVARRMIRRAIRRIWPDLRGMRLLGIGYATPFLSAVSAETERTVALMPATQGVLGWSPDGAQPRRARRRGRIALCRLFDRPGAAGARARNQRARRTDAEGDLAGAGGRRAAVDRRPQPARHLGAARPHPVRLRPALHDVATFASVARGVVHPGRDRHRAVHPAVPASG